AVCARSSARAQSPVSSQAVRSRPRWRTSTNWVNPSASASTASPATSVCHLTDHLSEAKGSLRHGPGYRLHRADRGFFMNAEPLGGPQRARRGRVGLAGVGGGGVDGLGELL